MTVAPEAPQVHEVVTSMAAVRDAIEHVIEGKTDQIDLALVVLLAEGHLLIEDVPGVGKTMLARALGKAIDCSVRRLQFTPDLLPSDITGVSIFSQATREFEFKPGGIFANIVVGDEINRASPKTQSALLEAMAERQVSSDGVTHELERPFMVIATQNPIEMEGTYPLPEAQRDRFMARITMGYPARQAEVAMLTHNAGGDQLASISPVTDADAIAAAIRTIRTVYVAPVINDYIVAIVEGTRRHPDLRLGASPRASLHLMRASRVEAALAGRDYVIPEDVHTLAVSVLAHRVLPTVEALVSRRDPEGIVAAIVDATAAPNRG